MRRLWVEELLVSNACLPWGGVCLVSHVKTTLRLVGKDYTVTV